jgi:hypothetical protein
VSAAREDPTGPAFQPVPRVNASLLVYLAWALTVVLLVVIAVLVVMVG